MSYKKLIQGFSCFRQKYFLSDEKGKPYRQLLQQGQNSETLMIACSDSRIDPAILTQSEPGDFFTIRNMAALIPPYQQTNMVDVTQSTIDFALDNLPIKDVIILGHRDCRGIHALAMENQHGYKAEPVLQSWLDIGLNVRNNLFEKMPKSSFEEKNHALEYMMILVSITHLMSFPAVEKKCKDKNLRLHGWFFDMERGELHAYDPARHCFTSITHDDQGRCFMQEKPSLDLFLEHYLKKQTAL